MTTNNPSDQYLQRAVRHEARARNYRRQANLLLERDNDTDCAGALLYESAKQCINAVANQRGRNPGTTGGKVNVVRELVREDPSGTLLMQNWQRAASGEFVSGAAPELCLTVGPGPSRPAGADHIIRTVRLMPCAPENVERQRWAFSKPEQ